MKYSLNKTLLLSTLFLFSFNFNGFAAVTKAAGLNENDWVYTVLKNDSLARIHQKFCAKNVSIAQLSQINHLHNPSLLHPGRDILIPISMLKTHALPVGIILLSGDVRIKKTDKDVFVKLNQTDVLSAGNTLQTQQNSIAKLRFADGSISNIQPNSSLKIESSHQYAGKLTYLIKLKLSEGRTEIIANPQHLEDNHLEVETPSAVAVVRGTQFRVGAEHDVAIEETLEGQVVFSAGNDEVAVGQGYGSVAVAGKPPLPPQKLPDAPVITAFKKQFNDLPVEFALNPKLEGLTWVAQLATDEAFDQLINEQTVIFSQAKESNNLSFSDLADGQYFLKLRTKDAHGLQSKDVIHAFVLKALPLPPVLILPAEAESITSTNRIFNWTALPQVNGYVVQIANDMAFNSICMERVTSYPFFQLAQSLPHGDYYWRVAEKSARLPLRFSKVRKFSL